MRVLAAVVLVAMGASAASAATSPRGVREITIRYVAHDGIPRPAYVLLPWWYGPHSHPALPLVISPHGRGVDGRANARLWGSLPDRGSFVVVNPDGQGRVLGLDSWGDPGEIDDLARMPQILRRALPWLRIAPHRIYAIGGSMGGQETLLLVAFHPHLLAGAAAFDSVTDLALRYGDVNAIPCDGACRERLGMTLGEELDGLLRLEVGGTPAQVPRAYARRSPLDWVRRIARSDIPLQVWWSTSDEIVTHQGRQSRALFKAILRANPCAPVTGYMGFWRHSAELRASSRLPYALFRLGLLNRARTPPPLLHRLEPTSCSVMTPAPAAINRESAGRP
jgi:pimeloyl-ACP methyl ester carboxylesterase